MADYNVNMKQWNGTSFDNVLPLAYNAKQLGGQSLAEVKQWVQDNGLLLYSGQYIGTGDYGVNNPTSVTFPFEPILFFFPSRFATICVNELTQEYKEIKTFGDNHQSASNFIKKSADGKTIFWYSYSDEYDQVNAAGDSYYFAAIGGYDMGGATEWVITSSGSWSVPKTGRYMLELYGGGGGTARSQADGGYTGGASCQHYDSISLTSGESVNVVIGSGVRDNNAGGETSFGSYSVSGGGGSDGHSGGAGAGNYGATGTYRSPYATDKNYGTGAFSTMYGYGSSNYNSTGGPGAVYLKYLGA